MDYCHDAPSWKTKLFFPVKLIKKQEPESLKSDVKSVSSDFTCVKMLSDVVKSTKKKSFQISPSLRASPRSRNRERERITLTTRESFPCATLSFVEIFHSLFHARAEHRRAQDNAEIIYFFLSVLLDSRLEHVAWNRCRRQKVCEGIEASTKVNVWWFFLKVQRYFVKWSKRRFAWKSVEFNVWN